ncbi:glycosyltransferase family 4 protein [Sphingosinicella sp. BN140058]|uniref:glycosyltransferase family 4 protein n=1 Tax=Sphingosinicella sp. BN140058 TaxID=1892855 RepID=UPI0010136D98|nr:glycosyltransferase family 4 protein [Sphingosinicella sp. BN140058]QAY78032.1 glycosyltransferase family 4 protein [Sphingosinicella sp. BN140058]
MIAQPPGRRHIAIVTAGLGAGGAERVIAQISGSWAAVGDKVTVISFDRGEDRVYHGLPERVDVVKLGLPRQAGASGLIARIRALRSALRRLDPDVVVSFLTKINILTLIATIGLRVPVAVAERNNPERQDAHFLWRLTSSLVHARASLVICQTQGSVRCIPRTARRRVKVIPNPVSPADFRPVSAGAPVLVAVGRLTRQKGFDLLVDAFATIADAHPAWELHIWGEGPERAALAGRAAAVGLSSRILLRGLSAEPGSWLIHADAFVLSSRYEGFPNVLGEALAAGLPVVATNCDFGPSDLVRDGQNGLLVAPDDVASLAAGLDRLLGDEALRARLRTEAPEAAIRYAPERIFLAWNDAVTSLGGTPPVRGECPQPSAA